MQESTPGTSGFETEHRIQIELLDTLVAAVQGDSPPPEIEELLHRLQDFSRAHFLSEELLMRLHSYAGYGQHVEAHDELIEMVAELRQRIEMSDFEAALAQAAGLRQRFVHHIHDQDRRLERDLPRRSG